MSTTDIIKFPEARRQLGMENRGLKKACARHGVRWLQINSRVLAIRRDDLELLLERASFPTKELA